MGGRTPTPGATRMIEWGTRTDHPGSLVLDRDDRMIFTGSTVTVPGRGGNGRRRGAARTAVVERLVDLRTIEVRFHDEQGVPTGEAVHISARAVLLRRDGLGTVVGTGS